MQARPADATREWMPFVSGVCLLLTVGTASRLPLVEWGLPTWFAVPVLIIGLALAMCLVGSLNVIEGAA